MWLSNSLIIFPLKAIGYFDAVNENKVLEKECNKVNTCSRKFINNILDESPKQWELRQIEKGAPAHCNIGVNKYLIKAN